MISEVHRLIDEQIGFDNEASTQARLIWANLAIRTLSSSALLRGPFYPVVYSGLGGSEAIVYHDWKYVAFHLNPHFLTLL